MASVICRSNPDTYIVKCVLSCCPGKVRAQRFPGAGTAFRITVVTDHTCELQEPLQMHKNVTSAYIASIISHVVVADLTVSPKVLMANVANTVGYAVSYSKVWRAKRKVLEGLFDGSGLSTLLTHVPGLASAICFSILGTRSYASL